MLDKEKDLRTSPCKILEQAGSITERLEYLTL